MVRVAAHFGEWVQGLTENAGWGAPGARSGSDWGAQVALVTLCCPDRGAAVTFHEADALTVMDPALVLGESRAAAMLRALGLPARGRITVAADLPAGGGAGMSTAALVALARAAGGVEHRIAAACLTVEGAVDPLMLPIPDAVLWAPRAARVLATMPPAPQAQILGAFLGPGLATDPGDRRFPAVDDLLADWAKGPGLARAARLASLSAARTTALRGPAGDPTPALAARLGALGWARAHTGSARALIFAPGRVPSGAQAALSAAGYAGAFCFLTGGG